MSEQVSLYLPEVEQHFLGLLIQYGSEIWGDVSLISEIDFSEVRQPIFNVIKQQLDAPTPQPVSPIILTEKLKTYGQITIGNVDTLMYLEALQRRARLLDKKEAISLLKMLKMQSVKRDGIFKIEKAKLAIAKAETFNDVVNTVDTTLSSINTEYFKTSETTPLFEGLIEIVEERGNNPISTENLGFQGPFPSINDTLGALIFPGSFTVVAARTGGQKSSLAFFYNLYIAEKYNLPILHLDTNEMTVEQLQMRAVSCMSRGRIPLHMVRSGEWRKSKEYTEIIREEIWPRVKKVSINYQNIGNMTPEQVVNFIKRFYYRSVGRGNHLLINLDYIKGAESFSKNTSEYQAVGYYVNSLKNLVTEQITASIWTSAQNNREGIITGKKAHEIIDSENSISLSDRIIQQATHGFSMRYKVPEELALEKNNFGNIKLTPLKTRELLGKNFERALMPIKLPNGKFVKNYYNLNAHSFHFEDKGDLHTMLDLMGHAAIDLVSNTDERRMP